MSCLIVLDLFVAGTMIRAHGDVRVRGGVVSQAVRSMKPVAGRRGRSGGKSGPRQGEHEHNHERAQNQDSFHLITSKPAVS